MKKLLSVLLCVSMLIGMFTFVSSVASADKVVDKAMLLDDISIPDDTQTGALGYIVNANKYNDYDVKAFNSDLPYSVQDANGIAVAFDLNVLSYSKCNHLVSEIEKTWRHQQGLIFTFSNLDGYQAIVYDVSRQEFQISNINWPRAGLNPDMSGVVEAKKVALNPGDWHRVFYWIESDVVSVYLDGTKILEHEFNGGKNNSLARSFLMFWPSHCRVMIDNMVVGTDEYDDTLGMEANEGQILFADDFNDAFAPEYIPITGTDDDGNPIDALGHNVRVPKKAVEKDEKGKDIEVEVLDEHGNPVLDKNGNVVKQPKYLVETDEKGEPKKDGEGNLIYVQDKDDDGNLLWETEYYYYVNGEVTKDANQEHAGFTFETFGEAVPYKGVDKAAYSGMIRDVAGATLSFADTQGVEGHTFYADITYDPTNGGFTKASNLLLSYDPIFTNVTIENVAQGVAINEDNGLVDITVPEGFSGVIGQLVLTIPEESEMAQSDRYRYGFIIGADTTFETSGGAVTEFTIDGGFTYTKNFIQGDADGDGYVNARDVIQLMKYNLILTNMKTAQKKGIEYVMNEKEIKVWNTMIKKAADVYPDGNITSRDTINLMKFLVNGVWPT